MEISCIQNCKKKKNPKNPNPEKMEIKRPRSLTVFIQWNDYSRINLLNKHFHQMFKKRYSFLNKSFLKRHCPKHVRFVECPEWRTIRELEWGITPNLITLWNWALNKHLNPKVAGERHLWLLHSANWSQLSPQYLINWPGLVNTTVVKHYSPAGYNVIWIWIFLIHCNSSSTQQNKTKSKSGRWRGLLVLSQY